MMMCDKHHEDLLAVLEERGLTHLVADYAEEAQDKLESQREHGVNASNFDPVIAANNVIAHAAIDCGGDYLLSPKEDGSEYCPLCELNEYADRSVIPTELADKEPSAIWISDTCDGVRRFCVESGFVVQQ